MESILNFSEPLNVSLLDRIVDTFYGGYGAEQMNAQKVLNQFQENPNAWQLVDTILENCQNYNTKYFALQILEKLVQTRWNSLPREQCEGIKNYIVSLVIKASTNEVTTKAERNFLNKLNLLLVQILKHEWPKHWPSFISEIVAASRTSLPLCENNMTILKLLSEEAFDFSADQMTTVKAKNLKTQLAGEFAEIFQLCSEVLELATKPSLIVATLEALLRFLKWIPLGYIFQTSLIETLRSRFLFDTKYRSVCLACLTEIAALKVDAEFDGKFVAILEASVEALNRFYPLGSTNFSALFASEREDHPRFIQNAALHLSTLLGNHLKALEGHASADLLILAHRYLLAISAVDDREVFKVCLEYWNRLVGDLYREGSIVGSSSSGLFLQSFNATQARKVQYEAILTSLRSVMIDKMVKPEEVLVVEDENGDIVREHVKESDVLAIYAVMRETLVFLTHLDSEDTKKIMLTRLSNQFVPGGWDRNELCRICWAVGSISGSMNEEMEKSFVIQVIRDLLTLCSDTARGKDNKAVVAANIMYVVGQYPRFLRQHWKFLKTVVNKLFEFMHELHEGVQDMACETFITITKRCHRQFVIHQAGESELFVDEIIRRMPEIIGDLTPAQVHYFYEAMGHVIGSQPDAPTQAAEISAIMAAPNETWDSAIRSLSADPTGTIRSPDTLKLLSIILKTNLSLCGSLGSPFMSQLSHIYMDMLSLYRLASDTVNDLIKQQGMIATKTPLVRALRLVKKDILRLVQGYVQVCNDPGVFVSNFIPLLLDAILSDYRQNIEQARDAEVLSLTAEIVGRFGELMQDKVAPILDAVFECTLNMINKDFIEYPEHRVNFFALLAAINAHCFPALMQLGPLHFKLIVDSCVWAFKHTHREIADAGLKICYELLRNVSGTAAASNPTWTDAFHAAFLIPLFTDIFYVLTDGEHKSGFRYHAAILAYLFEMLSSVRIPLSKDSSTSNAAFVKEYLGTLLHTAFPHLQRLQLETFLKGLFDLHSDLPTFKAHLRDFLVSLKEFSAEEQELFLEEQELEAERKRAAEREAARMIPGMLKPIELEEDSD